MLNFIVGMLCGVWAYKLYRGYQKKERHKLVLKEAIDNLKQVNKGNNGAD